MTQVLNPELGMTLRVANATLVARGIRQFDLVHPEGTELPEFMPGAHVLVLLSGAEPYRKPPQAVLDVLNSPLTPTLAISPTRHFAMQGQPIRYPPIAELAQPMLRIAGMRINPKTNGLHNTTFNSSLSLRKIPEGAEIKVDL